LRRWTDLLGWPMEASASGVAVAMNAASDCDSYLTSLASGIISTPLDVLFFERASPIGTGAFFFLLFLYSFSIFLFSPVYKKFEIVSKSEKKFEIVSKSEQISNGFFFKF
jgi:hypothetical protein